MCFYDGNFTFPSSFACFSRIKDKCGLIDFDVKEASFFVFVSTSSDKHLRHGTAYFGSSVFRKLVNTPLATAGCKNKLTVNRRRHHSVPRDALRGYFPHLCAVAICFRAKAMSAFLIPSQGLRRFENRIIN